MTKISDTLLVAIDFHDPDHGVLVVGRKMPGQIESIEKAHKQCIENGYYGGLFNSQDPDRLYGLTFKVTNPALAECILVRLLNNRLENFELGIDLQSIELDTTAMNRSVLKEKLLRAIDEIL